MTPSPAPSSGTRTGARRIASPVALLTLAAALVAGFWMGVGLSRTTLTSAPVLTGPVVESGTLYRLGMGALILDISNSDFVAELNRGPLHIGEDEVSRILHSSYDSTDTDAKAREVHTSLLDFLRKYPDEEIFRVSIADERPAMADSLGRELLQQYATLPDCGTGDDLSTLLSAARVRFLGGSGEDFFSEEHPDCRPPDMVADEVEEALREEIAEMAASGPDSVETFPDEEGDEAFAALVERVNRGLLWTHPGWPLLLLILAAGGYAAAHPRRELRLPLALFGTGLGIYGALALLVAPGRIQEVFEGAGTEGEASEIWGELGQYVLQRSATFSGGAALVLGLAFVGAFVLLHLRTGPRARSAT